MAPMLHGFVARLRAPYDTEGEGPTHATGPYRVEADGVRRDIEVSDAAVRGGATVSIDLSAVTPDAAPEAEADD